jgi:hypothetical protein
MKIKVIIGSSPGPPFVKTVNSECLLYRPAFQSNPPTTNRIAEGNHIISCLTVEPMPPAAWTPNRTMPVKINVTAAILSPTFLFTFGECGALGAGGGSRAWTVTLTPSGECPYASARIVEGPTVRDVFSPKVRSSVGQPHLQWATTFVCGS